MNIISISDLRKNLYNIVKRVVKSHEPVTIVNRNSEDAAVLISQRDWEDIQETLYLQSNKDARETIVSALGRPIEEGEEINWRNGE
jgi:antitoxin YefM